MLLFLVPLFLGVVSLLSAEPLSVKIQSESAILINADTGAILYDKDSHILQYPASITKVATALYALHKAHTQLDTMVVSPQEAIVSISEEAKRRSNYTVPAYWLVPGGTHIGIKKGEELSLRTLLYGLLLASGNDAANVIAHHVSGNIPEFIEAMNAYLTEIGCKQTTFCNPHGLHHPSHQTTASDMAVIMRQALKDPTFREIIATVRYQRPKTNKQESTTLLQTNKMMRKGDFYYPKAIGGKTGFLTLAGHTLVVAAQHEDRTLIAVVMKAKERKDVFQDAIALFEAAFNQPKVRRTLLKSGKQKFTCDIPGASSTLTTYISDDVNIEYYPAEEPKLKCMLHWNVEKPNIAKGQRVGELRLQTPEGNVVQTIPLLAQEAVSPTWLWSLRHLFD